MSSFSIGSGSAPRLTDRVDDGPNPRRNAAHVPGLPVYAAADTHARAIRGVLTAYLGASDSE